MPQCILYIIWYIMCYCVANVTWGHRKAAWRQKKATWWEKRALRGHKGNPTELTNWALLLHDLVAIHMMLLEIKDSFRFTQFRFMSNHASTSIGMIVRFSMQTIAILTAREHLLSFWHGFREQIVCAGWVHPITPTIIVCVILGYLSR